MGGTSSHPTTKDNVPRGPWCYTGVGEVEGRTLYSDYDMGQHGLHHIRHGDLFHSCRVTVITSVTDSSPIRFVPDASGGRLTVKETWDHHGTPTPVA